jgi:hypothetical protein
MAKDGKGLTRYHDAAFCTKTWGFKQTSGEGNGKTPKDLTLEQVIMLSSWPSEHVMYSAISRWTMLHALHRTSRLAV